MVANSMLALITLFIFNTIGAQALTPTRVSRQTTQVDCANKCSTIIQISQQCGNSDQCICTPNNVQSILAELPSCEACIQSLPPSALSSGSGGNPGAASAAAAALESSRAQASSSIIGSIGGRQLSTGSLPTAEEIQAECQNISSSGAPDPTSVASAGTTGSSVASVFVSSPVLTTPGASAVTGTAALSTSAPNASSVAKGNGALTGHQTLSFVYLLALSIGLFL